MPRIGFVLLVGLFEVGPVRGDAAKERARTAALVRQLDDPAFARREAAGKELERIGEPALPALKRAIATDPSPELRRRAEQVARRIMLTLRTSKATGLELTLAPPGQFTMGSGAREAGRRGDEAPHTVRLSDAFLIGKFEVTQEEYKKVTGREPSWFTATGGGKDKVKLLDTARFPVEQVTWFDAVAFCNALSKLDGYEPYYAVADERRQGDAIKAAKVAVAGGNGYRLPTEAEWEYACRAGTVTRFFTGTTAGGREGNFQPGPAVGYGGPAWTAVGRTTKVGSYKVNPWDLADAHGNVAEWCQDWYDKGYYEASPVDDPPGPATALHKVLRGGSWQSNEASARSASRFWHTPDEVNYTVGFRVARTP